MTALGTREQRDAMRFWAEDGDYEDAHGVLRDAVSGRPKEVVYEDAGVMFPIFDRRQVEKWSGRRAEERDRALEACFTGKYRMLAECSFAALLPDWDGRAVAACRSWVEGFDNPERSQEPRSVILSGGPGAGKTYMAAAMAVALVKAGKRGIFTSVRSIEDMAAGRFGSMSDVMERVCSRDFVVLDDFGSEYTGSWSVSQIYAVLDHFCQLKTRLVVTTNLSANQIRRSENPQVAKLVGRIREDARLVEVENPDRRQLAV